MVYRNTKRSSNGILPAITLSYRIFLVILAVEIIFQIIHNLLGKLRKPVFLYQRQHCNLNRSKCRMELKHNAALAILQLFLLICTGKHGQNCSVQPDRCLYHVWNITLVKFRVKILQFLARKLLMAPQIKVCAGVNALQLFKPKGKIKFNICCSIGIMSQFVVVMIPVLLVTHSKSLMPLKPYLLPFCKPLQFSTRFYEELHLHLLEFSHSEYELPCHYLISESFSNLCYTKRQFHPARLLHVQKVYENALCGLGTKVNYTGLVGCIPQLRAEHKVKLTDFRPVLCSRYRTNYVAIKNELSQRRKVIAFKGSNHLLLYRIQFCKIALHVRISCPELLLIKALAEFPAAFFHLFLYLFLEFCNIVFEQHICPVPFL